MQRLPRIFVLACLWTAIVTFAGPAGGQDEPRTRRVTTPGAQVQINQIETSQFPQVAIFATVLKDEVPVPGLTDKDFRVREDEVDQEALTVVPKLTPLSVVLTLDTSGSMKKRLADAQNAAKMFLAILAPQDKAQVLRFSREVRTIYPLGADRSAAGAAIDGTVARGDTALWDALYVSVESLREVTGRKAIVLLGDGVDDDGTGKPLSRHSVEDVLALARQVNVPIYAIGLGTELDEPTLKKVANETGALYLNAVEAGELTRLYDSIGKQLAGQYMISYTSNLPADNTEHRVQLKVGENTGMKSYLCAAAKPDRAVDNRPGTAEPHVAVPTRELFIAPGLAKLRAQLGPETPVLPKDESIHWQIYKAQADFDGRRETVAGTHKGQPTFNLNEGEYKLQVEYGDASRSVDLHVKDGSDSQGTIVLGAGQVRLSARLDRKRPMLSRSESIHWQVCDAQEDFDGRRKIIAGTHKGQPTFTLNEGEYILQVEYGDASRSVDLHVGAGDQKHREIVLGAGQVRLSARLGPETPMLSRSESIHWQVYEAQADFDGRRKFVAGTHKGQPTFTLNEGEYKLQIEYGDASRSVDLHVDAGDQKLREIVLGAGQVRLNARLGPETPMLSRSESIHWQVYEAQADFDGRRKFVAGTHKGQPTFTLNEGEYKLQVEYGNASRTVDLNVRAGEQKALEVQVTADR